MLFSNPPRLIRQLAATAPRRGSTASLLPSNHSAPQFCGNSPSSRRNLKSCAFMFVVGTLLFWITSRDSHVAPSLLQLVAPSTMSCEARGLVTPSPNDDLHKLTVRVRPSSDSTSTPDNTPLGTPFHPTLAASHDALFSHPQELPPPHSSSACISPTVQSLPIHSPPPPTSAPLPSIFFAMSTSPSRATSLISTWARFLAPSTADGTRPGCLVTDAQGRDDSDGQAEVNAKFKEQGLEGQCVMKESGRTGERYEMRVLWLIKDAWEESERRRWQEGAPAVEWFIFGDDDTFFTDPLLLRSLLAERDSREDIYLGGFSEAKANLNTFGRIAYGGAGGILSRGLVRKMLPLLEKCAVRFVDEFGGDGLLSNCAAWARGTPLSHLVEVLAGLNQMDMRGDASGFLQSGRAPFLSLHHWIGWLKLFPDDRSPTDAIGLLGEAARVVGGKNFLRRFVFDEGRVAWSVGYSVTVQRDALTRQQLDETEWTWEAHEPRLPSRAALLEGHDKLTYFLESVTPVSPTLAVFKHVCSHPSVQEGLREIEILWDTEDAQGLWKGLKGSGKVAKRIRA